MARRPRRKRSAPPQNVGDLLPGVLGDLGLDETSAAVRLLETWDAALGPELAPHCRPEGLRNAEVRALVRDSAWMQRIQLEKPRILARLGEHMGDDAPTGMRLRIGMLDEV